MKEFFSIVIFTIAFLSQIGSFICMKEAWDDRKYLHLAFWFFIALSASSLSLAIVKLYIPNL